MAYPILSEIQNNNTDRVSLGGLVLQYFTGAVPASAIIARVHEQIYPITPESEVLICNALIECAVKWYSVPDSAQPEAVAETVRKIISLL